jgi:GDP/UDP-N,N'-diacetylbacillosamine 2-epimerase (hydrolysing)
VSRTICVVSGTRADYGLLRWIMTGIRDAPDLRLQIAATGAHLSPEHGLTCREIEADGFHIDRRVDMRLGADTPVGVATSMGVATIGFAAAFHELRPDLVVLLGDRSEILSAASAALVARIPVAHVHGGESSEGAFDESIRHAVTKMSHLHFVAAREFGDRVVQMGEDPSRVFVVGGLGVDAIARVGLLDRTSLEGSLGFDLGAKSLLVTFHPATLDVEPATDQFAEVLAALEPLAETRLVFTMPNADPGGRALWHMVESFAATHANARAVVSLGHRRYLSCLQYVDGIIGNSSSGLTEAPTFRIGTVNVGSRQRGRPRAGSVIDCAAERRAIAGAVATLFSPAFRATLAAVRNPYGDGGASERIVAILRSHPLDNLVNKSFHDIRLGQPVT